MGIDGQVYFSDHVKTWKCTTEPVEPVNGINKDVCGAKLLLNDCPGLSCGLSLCHLATEYTTLLSVS